MRNRTGIITLVALGGLFLLASAGMRWLAGAVSIAPILDVRFGYSVGEAVSYVESLDGGSRARYAMFQRFDGGYMLVYGAFLTLALATLTEERSPRWRYALALPIAAVAADATEGVLVAVMLDGSLEPTLIRVSSFATRLKFVLFGGSIALGAGLLLHEWLQRPGGERS